MQQPSAFASFEECLGFAKMRAWIHFRAELLREQKKNAAADSPAARLSESTTADTPLEEPTGQGIVPPVRLSGKLETPHDD